MYLSWLEWEGLQKSYDIDYIYVEDRITSKSLPPKTERVKIFRDDLYNIKGIINGKFEDPGELELLLEDESVPSGTFIEPKNLILSDVSAQYDINGFMVSRSGLNYEEKKLNMNFLHILLNENLKILRKQLG